VGEYATELTDITDAYVVESQNLSYDYQSSVEDGVRDIVAAGGGDAQAQVSVLARSSTVQYLAMLGDVMDRYLQALDGLAVPSQLEDPHDEYVSAVRAVHTSLPATRSAVEEAADLEGMQSALSVSGLADGQLRWTATCVSLEESIRALGRGVDLRCVRTEVTP
jgi:hypothetical protein